MTRGVKTHQQILINKGGGLPIINSISLLKRSAPTNIIIQKSYIFLLKIIITSQCNEKVTCYTMYMYVVCYVLKPHTKNITFHEIQNLSYSTSTSDSSGNIGETFFEKV